MYGQYNSHKTFVHPSRSRTFRGRFPASHTTDVADGRHFIRLVFADASRANGVYDRQREIVSLIIDPKEVPILRCLRYRAQQDDKVFQQRYRGEKKMYEKEKSRPLQRAYSSKRGKKVTLRRLTLPDVRGEIAKGRRGK